MGGSGDGSVRRAVGDRAWRRWFLHRGEADGAVDGASRKLTQKLPDHRPSARGAQPFLGDDQTFTAARSDQSGRTPHEIRERELTVGEILALAGKDPASVYLVEIKGQRDREPHKDPTERIKLHPHSRFVTVSCGETPVS
jgi:hypothetical protein